MPLSAHRGNPPNPRNNPPPLVEVLHTRAFKNAFFSGLSRKTTTLTVVSPFVTPIPGFPSVYDFFRSQTQRMPTATFTLITRPPDDDRQDQLSWQEADLIEQLGVELFIWPNSLHSKVYYFVHEEGDSTSFVGSSNFTKGGFQTNRETVAFWRRSQRDTAVEQELARLSGPGSFDLLQWKIHRISNP